MTKSKTSTGASRTTAPAKRTAPKTSATAKNRTARAATTKAKPAPRTTTARPRTRTRTAAKRTTQRGARQEGAPARLQPITQRQSRAQILATVARDSGVEPRTVERVARSLSRTLQRHLIRRGSGRVEIPYLGGALWRGHSAAQQARTMLSPILGGREVKVPARRAQPVPRFKPYRTLRDTVARI